MRYWKKSFLKNHTSVLSRQKAGLSASAGGANGGKVSTSMDGSLVTESSQDGVKKAKQSPRQRFWALCKSCQAGTRRGAVFVPGIFFCIMGLFTLFAPQLLISVVACFFIFVGGFLCFAAWKFLQLKHKIEETAQKFEARIYLQGVGVRPYGLQDETSQDKKIVYH